MTPRIVGRVLTAVAVAIVVVWAGRVYQHVLAISRATASAEAVRQGRAVADYDALTLPWSKVDARTLDTRNGRLTFVSGDGPFLYQATATVATGKAPFAHLAFRGDIAHGGITIGLLSNGRWVGMQSIQQSGVFTGVVRAPIDGASTLTIVVANCNASGQSAGRIDELKLYFVK